MVVDGRSGEAVKVGYPGVINGVLRSTIVVRLHGWVTSLREGDHNPPPCPMSGDLSCHAQRVLIARNVDEFTGSPLEN